MSRFWWPRSVKTKSRSRKEGRPAAARLRASRRPWLERLEDLVLPAPVSWVLPTGGDWSNPSAWSTGALPGPADDVTINVAGVTVTHSTGTDTIRSLVSSDAFVLSGGSLAVSGSVQVNNTFTLSGGTLAGATVAAGTTITGQGGQLAGAIDAFGNVIGDIGGPLALLDGVTLDGDLAVSGGQAVSVRDGLTLNGTATLGSAADGSSGVLKFLGSQALSGSGTVTFAGGNAADAVWLPIAGTTLTVGPGVSVQGQAGSVGYVYVNTRPVWQAYVNLGLPPPVPLYSSPASVAVVSQGAIRATGGGTVSVGGTGWSNQGTAIIGAAGTVAVMGDYTQTPSGSLNITIGGSPASGLFGQLQVSGAVTLDGSTLNISRSGAYNPVAGDSYQIMTFGSRSPANSDFATKNGLSLPNSLAFNPVYHPNDLTLTVAASSTVTPAFSGLSSPTITYGTPSVTLSGTLSAGTLIPSGSVAITLNGVTQAAAIDASTGYFSSSFVTSALGASAVPYAIGYSYAGNSTFTGASGTGSLTVKKAHLTVTADSKSRVYGDPNPALTYTLSGFQSGDTPAVFSGSPTLSTAATPSSPVGNYAITVVDAGTLSAANYDFPSANFVAGTLTVTKATLTVTADNQTRQYSDPNPTFTASYSGFKNGETLATSGVTGSPSLATAAGLSSAPGGYAITAAQGSLAAGNYSFAFANGTLTVTREDARATYTGVLFASTSSATSSTASLTLSATVQDISAVPSDPAYDPYPGDIRNATVTFVNRATGQDIATVPVGLVSPSDTRTGTATYVWAVNIGSANSQTYTVGIRVGGYYTRNTPADDADVTVSRPLDNAVTGGGYIVAARSAGRYAADAGTRINFGFNVKFNPGGTNLQGHVNIIFRRTEADGVLHVYQIKSTAIDSLSVNAATGAATFTSKATIQDVTDPLNPVSVAGNLRLQITMQDNGEPGSSDTIGITLWDTAGGLAFSSDWDGLRTVAQLLSGGNLQTHSGGSF